MQLNDVQKQAMSYALNTQPKVAFKAYCRKHQKVYTNVRISTLMQNNKHQANFLYDFYNNVIICFQKHPKLIDDEEYAALVSYYYHHMVNVGSYDNYSHSHNGTNVTKDGKEARSTSFHYCMTELLPSIQKTLRCLLI